MKRVITKERIERFQGILIKDEKSKVTVEKYVRDIRAFYEYIKGEQLSKEKVIEYKQYLMGKYAPVSVNSMLAGINKFFKEMGWHDLIVKSIRIQRLAFREKERELTKAEYYRLLDAAKEKKDKRLYLVMQTICSTGIRVSELSFITVEAIKTGRAIVSLKGKTRQVLIPRALMVELRRYTKERDIKKGSVFITRTGKPIDRSNILHEMKALCESAGVEKKKVFPHNLRHLFACLYYKAQKDLGRLADILGHSNINTTRIYTSVNGAEQQRQIERLGLIYEKKKPHNKHYAVDSCYYFHFIL